MRNRSWRPAPNRSDATDLGVGCLVGCDTHPHDCWVWVVCGSSARCGRTRCIADDGRSRRRERAVADELTDVAPLIDPRPSIDLDMIARKARAPQFDRIHTNLNPNLNPISIPNRSTGRQSETHTTSSSMGGDPGAPPPAHGSGSSTQAADDNGGESESRLGITVEARDLTYCVPVTAAPPSTKADTDGCLLARLPRGLRPRRPRPKALLRHVSFTARPGRLTYIMGGSGAGCIDCEYA